jgi:hypothetical protein
MTCSSSAAAAAAAAAAMLSCALQDPLNVSGKLISEFHHVKFVSGLRCCCAAVTACYGVSN